MEGAQVTNESSDLFGDEFPVPRDARGAAETSRVDEREYRQ